LVFTVLTLYVHFTKYNQNDGMEENEAACCTRERDLDFIQNFGRKKLLIGAAWETYTLMGVQELG
jgi:hypothetical protein